MYVARIFIFLFLFLMAVNAHAGSKLLSVAFFDYSSAGLGKSSFKSLRASRYEHACWQKFGEIEGIETAYIENPPKSLDRELLLAAVHGSAVAAKQFSKLLGAEKLDGAYAFIPDATGAYVTVYGLNYQNGAISSSASFRMPTHGLVEKMALSRALCEASLSMD
jgi:hypothetical protein